MEHHFGNIASIADLEEQRQKDKKSKWKFILSADCRR